MKNIILKYLDKNCYLLPESINNFKIYDRTSGDGESIHMVVKTITKIFGVEIEETHSILNGWMDEKANELDNHLISETPFR